jgi:hypothetical protein
MSRLKTHLAVPWLGLFALSWSANSTAQNRWQLSWDAPEGCPQKESVLLAVRDIVGEDIFASTTLDASGLITRETSGKFRLALRIIKDGGEQLRTLDATACEDLLGASAVVLGLHLKKEAAELAKAEEVDPKSPTSNDASRDRAAAEANSAATAPNAEPPQNQLPNPEPADRSSQPRTRNFWIGPRGGLVTGSLPKSDWTYGLTVGLRSDVWRLWVAGRYQTPQQVPSSAAPNVGAVSDKYSAEVGVSPRIGGELFEFSPGIFAGVDHVVARGDGEHVTSSRATTNYPFIGAELTLRALVTDWIAVPLSAAGEVPLSRPSLQIQSLGEVARINPVHLRVSLGLEWNF